MRFDVIEFVSEKFLLLFFYTDRGNDNWLIKYDEPKVENPEGVIRLAFN